MDRNSARPNILLFMFIGAFILLVLRLFYIQVIRHSFYKDLSSDQRLRAVELLPDRGDIFDRKGNLLATSVKKWSVYVRPRAIANRKEILALLIKADGQNEKLIREKFASGGNFWLRRKAEKEFAEKIAKIGTAGIDITPEKKRIYPKGRLAAQLVGFAGLDNKGLSGMELALEKHLLGKPGRYVFERDPAGREIFSAVSRQINAAEDGMNVFLTIDEPIQYFVQRELESAVRDSGAIAGSVIVMDIKNGDVLAIAGWPDFDPNEYSKFPPSIWRLSPVTDIYEPGSTFKMITACAGMDEGLFVPESVIPSPEELKVGGITVKNSHPLKMDRPFKDLTDVIAESLNTGTAHVGIKLGRDKLYSYIKKFGFGSYTGVGFPGEQPGMLFAPSRWRESDLATISFGQTLAVTPLQLVSAISAIANGGVRMKPRLVRRIESPDGSIVRSEPEQQFGSVISKATARKANELMKAVAYKQRGTGHKARINGFSVAVKTGTAQKPVPGKGYVKGKYIASIVGYAPASDPRIAVLVVVDEPKESIWGATVAAPVFKNVAEFSLRSLNVAPDL